MWGVADAAKEKPLGFPFRVEAAGFKLSRGSAQQWEYPQASHLPDIPSATQKEVNEQGQKLPMKEEILSWLLMNL